MANFGISEKIEKIETFISENLKIFGYDLNFLIWTPQHNFIILAHELKATGGGPGSKKIIFDIL